MTIRELIKQMAEFTIEQDIDICIDIGGIPVPIDLVQQDLDLNDKMILILKPMEQ